MNHTNEIAATNGQVPAWNGSNWIVVDGGGAGIKLRPRTENDAFFQIVLAFIVAIWLIKLKRRKQNEPR